jgi:ribosomal protein S16
MKNDHELIDEREELEDGVEVIGQVNPDSGGHINISQEGVSEMLDVGVKAIDELERLRTAVGPQYLAQLEPIVDAMKRNYQ